MPIEQLPEELKHAPQAVFDKLNEVIEAFNALSEVKTEKQSKNAFVSNDLPPIG